MGRIGNNGKAERRIVMRRPASGICQFCLKVISAANWSRHIKSMHQQEILDMQRKEHIISKEEPDSTPENSPLKKLVEKSATIEEKHEQMEMEEVVNKEPMPEAIMNRNELDLIPNGQQEKEGTSVEAMREESVDVDGDEKIKDSTESPMGNESQPLRRSLRNALKKSIPRCPLKLPKSNICPLCDAKTSLPNWSRHLKRYHPEYTPSEADLPLLHLEHFLVQQIQHNDMFGADEQSSSKNIDNDHNNSKNQEEMRHEVKKKHTKIGEIGGTKRQQKKKAIMKKEISPGDEQQPSEGTISNHNDLFPERRIIIRRPYNGICQFCERTISASNWSRHLRSLHLQDVIKMRQGTAESPSPGSEMNQPKGHDEEEYSPENISSTPMEAIEAMIKVENSAQEEAANRDDYDDTIAAVIGKQLQYASREASQDIADVLPFHFGKRNSVANRTCIKKTRSLIPLPKSNICPLCERTTSPGNWSRHLKRHHPEYAIKVMEGDEWEEIAVNVNGSAEIDDQYAEFVASTEEIRSFVIRSMQSIGTSFAHAVQLAELLLDADMSGHYNFGLSQLPMYLHEVSSGFRKTAGEPKILKQKGATAWVDGANLLGAVVGNFCTDLAINLAREHGIGWVLANNSNHYGMGQYYAKRIGQVGLVGMSFSNTAAPFANGQNNFGQFWANPISCCANSAKSGDGFLLDMPTSSAKIDNGNLFGAMESNGLGMMVEMFCHVMAGAGQSNGTSSNGEQKPDIKRDNLGQCFVAVDPECFASSFAERLQHFLDQARECQPFIPGDHERLCAGNSQDAGGLIYTRVELNELEQLATKCRVQMFVYKPKQKEF